MHTLATVCMVSSNILHRPTERQEQQQEAGSETAGTQAEHSHKASALRMVKRIRSRDPWVLSRRYQHIKEEQQLRLAQLHELSLQVKQTEQWSI